MRNRSLFTFGKVIKFDFEDNFEETTQYCEQLESDWFTFWQTKGEEIVNNSWSHTYSDYLLKDEAEEQIETENTPKEQDEAIGETEVAGNTDTDPLKQVEHQGQTENPRHQLNAESIDHQGGTGETLTANLENNLQADTNDSSWGQERQTESENEPHRLKEESQEHQKEDTAETLEAETAEPSWQEVWDDHYLGVYQKTYKQYSLVHYNQYCFYRSTIEEIVEEFLSESKEEEVEFVDQTEELRALGLPTSFCRRNYKAKLYDSCSESLTDEEAEMVSTEKRKRKNKNNRKLQGVPKMILENRSLRPYWHNRYTLFSRFEEGIQLDPESWFSVTPEKVALHMAERLRCDTIIDAFCGSGGNAIQFAFSCSKVIAIDIDAEKIKNARHNAIIYGVAHKIDFIIGDFLHLCDSLKGDVVFLSPPWGGPKYMLKKEYDIEESLIPLGASALAEKARQISENIAFFLPRNSIPKQMAKIAGVGNRVEIEHNFLDTRLVGLTAIYGDWLIDKKNLGDK